MNNWIPIKTRPMTEEEIEHFEYIGQRVDDANTILDCPLPEDGQEVLVSWGNNVSVDIFIRDNDGCYFEDRDIDEVTAWMPLPEPYKDESDIKSRKECPHKPCINYEDGCEEWAGCPCVHYKAESEEA